MEEILSYVVTEESAGDRLDIFLAGQPLDLSRSYVKRLISEGAVRVSGRREKPSYKVKLDELVELVLPEPRELSLEAEDIPLEVLFEDEDLIVINKGAGMMVHPAGDICRGTLVNALLGYCDHLSQINGVLRLGIVHRLDKDTTGALVVAKTDKAHLDLARQFHLREVKKVYLALVHGVFKEERGTIELPIGRHHKDRKKMAVDEKRGREAVTHYEVNERFRRHSLLKIRLETGRTHQIRVHLAYIHHPLVGDPVYGRRKDNLGFERQALHAYSLGFTHPITGEYLEFIAPLPEDMNRLLEKLRGCEGRKGSSFEFQG